MSNPNSTGITTAVLKGANAPRFIAPDMSQDHEEANQGDFGAVDLRVEHQVCGREVVRKLPGNLQTSPLK